MGFLQGVEVAACSVLGSRESHGAELGGSGPSCLSPATLEQQSVCVRSVFSPEVHKSCLCSEVTRVIGAMAYG